MTERELFESAFPVPSGVRWQECANDKSYFAYDGEYLACKASTHRNQRRNSLRANAHNMALKVWLHRRDEVAELKYKLSKAESTNG